MKVVLTKTQKIKQTLLRIAMATTGLALVAGAIFFFRALPVANAETNPGLDAGNATVSFVGGDTVLTYKTTGNSTFKAPAGVTSVRVLAIGGGGAGGTDNAGGGGAGGFIENTNFAVTPGAATTVTVGAGGTATPAPGSGKGGNGGNSVFGTLTAVGGGGGGYHGGVAGNNGGSGGGVGGNSAGNGGTGTAGQGTNGGSRAAAMTEGRNGGGGGATSAGSDPTTSAPGAGGAGKSSNITGTSTTYAGGGGGAGRNDSGNVVQGAAGGAGGGGKGAGSNGVAVAGTANTGSGGGGGANNPSNANDPVRSGASGGSGIVVVRFATKTSVDVAGVTGVVGWYKADSAGNTNALWNDVSGLGFNMTQSTASKQPVLATNGLNFNPAYTFDGTDDALSLPAQGVGATNPMAAFYAASLTDTSGGYRYLTEFGDDTPSISVNNGKPDLYVRGTSPVATTYSTVEALSPRVYSFMTPTTAGTRIVGVNNKEETGTFTGSYTTATGATGSAFGSANVSSGKPWKGPIGEALFFNRQLTAAERLKINSYLALKYAVTINQGASGTAYVDSAGTTIWPADATYKNAVTGIGRDDASTLNQKQSKNVDDIVVVGRGDIAATNQANANTFTNDKTFLLWAHNGGVTDQATTVTGTDYLRMARVWKTVSTGTVGTVKLQIPKSVITRSTASVFISNSATFSSTSTRVDMTSNGANYEAVVTLPAGAYFTFGSLAGADLQFVSKTAANSANGAITSYSPGESIKYILKVKNNGPDAAGTVTVTDTLPASVVPVSATGSGWNCGAPAGQAVTCTLSTLASGATAADITIEANVASSATGTKVNTATASTATDPDTSNNSASVSLTAAPKADLSIAKGHTGIPTAGNPHTYNFTVRNNGPSDVASFTVTDTLDSNLSYTSASGAATCSAAAQVVTCTSTGALADGQTATFSVTVNVSAGYAGGTITNTGTVAVPAGTTDPNNANNSSTDSSNVTVDTDLGITKSHTGNFTAGSNNSFAIAVENQGPSNAPVGAVTVTDTLDDDFAFVSATGTGWNCAELDGTVSCTNTAAINAGDTAQAITLVVLVDSVAKGSAPNTAEVSSTTPDSDLSDNSSTDTPTIVSEADLALTKAHVGTAFTAGQQEQYTLTVTNAGPSADAPSYTITDTLPAGVSFVSATGDATCSASGQNVTCTGGGIAVGAPAQVTTITVAIAGSATGTITNTATVAPAPGTTDPNTANNTSTDNASVEPNADLSITKTHAGDLTAGSNATYTFTVTNNGPSDVTSYTITDTLDGNLVYQSSSAGLTCTGTTTITCTGGAITSGNQDVQTVTVKVDSAVTPGSAMSNTANVTPPAGVNDPDMSNNSSTVSNNVVASADLAASKGHTGNFTAGSSTNDFTIEITNNGPSDASTFTMTDVLPAGMTYVSSTGTGVACTNAGQTVTCSYGPTISAGQTVPITLTVRVDADMTGGSTLNNSASVSSATPDPDMSNNTGGPDTVTIDSSADLAITKTHSTPDFTAGNNESYNLAVTNNGPSDVTSFTISDSLASDLTYVSATGATCNAVAQDVTCTGGSIDSGDTVNVVLTLAVSASVVEGTNISNTATVATVAPTTDPDMSNNDSSVSTTVVDSTDLALTKSHTGTFTAGDNAAYTMTVVNNGPSDTPTSDVTVTDTLPSGMTYVPAGSGGTGWTCSEASGTVTCEYAPALANGATAPTLTVNVAIAADKEGSVTNSATVSSVTDDPNPSNDTDTDTTTIVAEADLTATKVAQGSLTAGEAVTYRFEVTNNTGPSVANAVTITDDLDGHFTYQGFSGTDWGCSESGGTVTCNYGATLGVGDSTTVDVTLVVAPDAPNPLDNTAAVTFDGTDPTPANPSDSEPVAYSADLEVAIEREQKVYHSGEQVQYKYIVTNHGPSVASDVVLKDSIPSGLIIDSVSKDAPGGDNILAMIDRTLFPTASAADNPFNCSLNGSDLECTTGTLMPGVYDLHVTAHIADGFTGNLTTALSITSSTPDPNPNNNSATDTISDVQPATGLAGSGQSILLWIGTAVILAAGAIAMAFRKRHMQRS
ncbi:CARDB domain-containing protein [Streptomyces caniscabiei]|uniref:glycine-rich domain-containing protein n=1 Tax=Streptomyces caniscabiei TaxID=2746961 RepID=UPI0029A0F1C0|nr:CARDB domain-containing protein [Streptomyces caniscabiei]MDX2776495.1 CARDB domain-containing protein [Streptomyces caniscabiei]